MTQSRNQGYRSYLLRCWEEADGMSGITIWRFSLQDARTGERRGFTNLTELVIALQIDLIENKRLLADENKNP